MVLDIERGWIVVRVRVKEGVRDLLTDLGPQGEETCPHLGPDHALVLVLVQALRLEALLLEVSMQ